ncbi:hypothetical protein RA28_20795 [Ruegeria sp. ANG-S4]|uniref:hypothetical protein n=1 Tax=Ruegeria sp. ANG-S4 TaxID=1577904 RepID=UPI00057DC026|nr:hypothetical protein [Ruegeria sp. ANG-S4]KIC41816.1 hypothetical protein RA28_20795 [Ruegeria sp. ANG-S4]
MKRLLILGFTVSLMGCETTPPSEATASATPTNDDLLLVRGYRSTDDDCQLTGETAFTVNFLDDAADLVSCPTDGDAAQSLVQMYGAVRVAETGGYTVYTVPRR